MRSLARAYEKALEKHLVIDPGILPDPETARKLGSRALKLEIDLLELAKIHEHALAGLAKKGPSHEDPGERTRRGADFFNLVLAPIEKRRFTLSEANHQLKAGIEALTLRTEALDRSNKKLLVEIARRREVEESLRTSEATTSLLLTQAHEMQEQMRSLSRRLITAQENERRRISRELHDVIAQTLAGINVRLAVLRSQNTANAEEFHEKIEITERQIEQSVEIVHRFASDLRPVILDDIGLVPALRTFIDSFTEQHSIPVTMVASPEVEELESSALTALFRIAQEALNNTARHAAASLVNIKIRPVKNAFRMSVSDNGKGFTINRTGPSYDDKRLGIIGMRERAEMVGGSFQIDSAVGKGTSVRVDIPRSATTPIETSLPGPDSLNPLSLKRTNQTK